MASSYFEAAVNFVIDKIEKGYVNNPDDPGGETNWGIAKRSHPDVDIKNLTREGAVAIYKREYWDALRCESFGPKLAIVMFDTAVNEGVAQATLFLQEALGVIVDGHIGPVTLHTAALRNEEDTVDEYMSRRACAYAMDPNARSFELGWSRRMFSLLRFIDGLP